MLPCRLDELFLSVHAPREMSGSQIITHIGTDSRQAGPGSLFVALKGKRTDGHLHVKDALARGAEQCVVKQGTVTEGIPLNRLIEVEDPLKTLGRLARVVRRKLSCRVTAITGSIGKTTAKDILAALLEGSRITVKAPESFNNDLGVPLTIFQADADTQVLVMELGTNHPGEIRSLCEIAEPTDGVIVSIAPVHLEGFGSIEGIVEEKGQLAASLPLDGTLYLAAGMSGIERFRERASCCVKPFGEGTETSCQILSAEERGVTFRLGKFDGEFFLPGGGRQHMNSTVAAIAVALDYGVPPSVIRERLLNFVMPSLRWHMEDVAGRTLISDCYNASPNTVTSAVKAASTLKSSGRLTAVLGDMLELGRESERFHYELGEFLCNASVSRIFLLGEKVSATYNALSAKGFSGELEISGDRDSLAEKIAGDVQNGDVVLFKASRSVKLEKVVGQVKQLLYAQEH